MSSNDAIEIGREAVMVCLSVGAPILVVGLVIGIAIGVIQAMTHVQDQTVSFVPKIILMVVAMGCCLPWLADRMVDYGRQMLERPFVIQVDCDRP